MKNNYWLFWCFCPHWALLNSCLTRMRSSRRRSAPRILLGRMTLDEKIAQLECIWTDNKKKLFTDGKFDEKKAAQYYKDGLGFMARPNENLFPLKPEYHAAMHPRQAAELYNKIQHYFVEDPTGHTSCRSRRGRARSTQSGCHLLSHADWIQLFMGWRTGQRNFHHRRQGDTFRWGGSEGPGPVLDVVRDPRWGAPPKRWWAKTLISFRVSVGLPSRACRALANTSVRSMWVPR